VSGCADHGVCQINGACRCFTGFLAQDCSGRLTDSDAGYLLAIQLRITESVLFGFLLILILYRLILEMLRWDDKVSSNTTMCKYILVLLASYCVCHLIGSADYWGTLGNVNIIAYWVFFFSKDFIFLFMSFAVLLHWIELYHSTIPQQIKRDHKWMSNNKASVKEVLNTVTYLRSFRIAYLAICVFSVLILMARIVVTFVSTNPSQNRNFGWFYNVFYTAAWLGFVVGFFIYGFRLIRIFPAEFTIRIRRTMIFMLIFNVIILANQLTILSAFISAFATGLAGMRNNFAFLVIQFLCCFAPLNIYMPIWKYHKWFNPYAVRQRFLTPNFRDPNPHDLRSSSSPTNEVKVDVERGESRDGNKSTSDFEGGL